MCFLSAVKIARLGGHISRGAWKQKYQPYLYTSHGNNILRKSDGYGDPYTYKINQNDVFARDWFVLRK